MTAGFVNEHTSVLGRSLVGRDAYRQRLPGFFAQLPDLRYDVEDVVADGAKVVVAYRLHARPAGKDVTVRGVFRFVVDGPLIAQRTDYWDSGDYLRQIGDSGG